MKVSFSESHRLAKAAAHRAGLSQTDSVYDTVISEVIVRLWRATSKADSTLNKRALRQVARTAVVDGMRRYYGRNRRHFGHVAASEPALAAIALKNRHITSVVMASEGVVVNVLKEYPPKGRNGPRTVKMIQEYIDGDPMWRIGEHYGITESGVCKIFKSYFDQVKAEGVTERGYVDFEPDDLSITMSQPFS